MNTFNKLKSTLEKIRNYGVAYLFWRIMDAIGLSSNDRVNYYVEKYYLNLTQKEREEELKKWFLDNVGYPFDLDNPKTFNEKIQWFNLSGTLHILFMEDLTKSNKI